VSTKTLSKFYRRHKVTYRVVKYRYANSRPADHIDVHNFVVELARRIERRELVVYFDETSVNMWIRKRMTWSHRDQPVKMHLNKYRGHGVTVLGAIGERLPKGVFSLANTTNQHEVAAFLLDLRAQLHVAGVRNSERIVLVLDNHPSHGT